LGEVYGYEQDVDHRYPMILEEIDGLTVLASSLDGASVIHQDCRASHQCRLRREERDRLLEVLRMGYRGRGC
jgi:hypothetical protein